MIASPTIVGIPATPSATVRPSWSRVAGILILTGGVSLTGATILEVTTDVANDPGPAIAFWVLFLASTLAHVAAMFPLALGRGDGRGAVGASLVGRAALLGFGAFFLANQSMYLFTAYLVPTVVLPAGAANFLFAMSAAQGVLLLVGGTIILGARVLTGPARWAVLALSLVGFAVGSVATSASLETLTNTMYFLSTGTQIVAGIVISRAGVASCAK